MANNFSITNNTTDNRWDLQYTVDAAGTKETTIKTAGTFVDKDIKVAIATPTATLSYTNGNISGGQVTGANAKISSINNGISISRDAINFSGVSYNSTTSGYVNVTNGAVIVSASQISSSVNYLEGVRLEAPSSGTRTFYIDVPNGNTTDFISFKFSVNKNGEVTIVEESASNHSW